MLKTDFKDDVLDEQKNELRRFRMIENSDGTVSFVDVTEYKQMGDVFSAENMNQTNATVNEISKSVNNLSSGTINGNFTVYADGSSPDPDLKVRDGRVDILKTDNGNSVALFKKDKIRLESSNLSLYEGESDKAFVYENSTLKTYRPIECNNRLVMQGSNPRICFSGTHSADIRGSKDRVYMNHSRGYVGVRTDNAYLGYYSSDPLTNEPETGIAVQGKEKVDIIANKINIGRRVLDAATTDTDTLIELRRDAKNSDIATIKLRAGDNTKITLDEEYTTVKIEGAVQLDTESTSMYGYAPSDGARDFIRENSIQSALGMLYDEKLKRVIFKKENISTTNNVPVTLGTCPCNVDDIYAVSIIYAQGDNQYDAGFVRVERTSGNVYYFPSSTQIRAYIAVSILYRI
ncbi:MAG: hypothetical protein NC094_12100 [Bacteroidales bacterium]|nr:hypothetical protein [Lachnoclostridium sp.]MCM1385262.1 hypothetical protein [Lachnoclostridium sp.]MCM1466152.1 hypothetical protein [Bacteroidales bacterium]